MSDDPRNVVTERRLEITRELKQIASDAEACRKRLVVETGFSPGDSASLVKLARNAGTILRLADSLVKMATRAQALREDLERLAAEY